MAITALAAGAISSVGVKLPDFGDVLGIFTGKSRNEKRELRDKYLNILYSLGMSRNIVLDNSDQWAVLKYYTEIAQTDDRIISALNKVIPQTGGRIYSEKSDQFQMVLNQFQEIAAGNSSGSNDLVTSQKSGVSTLLKLAVPVAGFLLLRG